MSLRTRLFSVAAVAILAFSTLSARAEDYTFSFSGGGLSGSGLFTISDALVSGVPGAYQITSITGTFSDANIGLSNAMITGLQNTSLPSGINSDGTFLPSRHRRRLLVRQPLLPRRQLALGMSARSQPGRRLSLRRWLARHLRPAVQCPGRLRRRPLEQRLSPRLRLDLRCSRRAQRRQAEQLWRTLLWAKRRHLRRPNARALNLPLPRHRHPRPRRRGPPSLLQVLVPRSPETPAHSAGVSSVTNIRVPHVSLLRRGIRKTSAPDQAPSPGCPIRTRTCGRVGSHEARAPGCPIRTRTCGRVDRTKPALPGAPSVRALADGWDRTKPALPGAPSVRALADGWDRTKPALPGCPIRTRTCGRVGSHEARATGCPIRTRTCGRVGSHEARATGCPIRTRTCGRVGSHEARATGVPHPYAHLRTGGIARSPRYRVPHPYAHLRTGGIARSPRYRVPHLYAHLRTGGIARSPRYPTHAKSRSLRLRFIPHLNNCSPWSSTIVLASCLLAQPSGDLP